MSARDRILWRVERIDTYMHIRFRWSPRFICDLTELSYGCPPDEPHNWRGGKPSRVARLAFKVLGS